MNSNYDGRKMKLKRRAGQHAKEWGNLTIWPIAMDTKPEKKKTQRIPFSSSSRFGGTSCWFHTKLTPMFMKWNNSTPLEFMFTWGKGSMKRDPWYRPIWIHGCFEILSLAVNSAGLSSRGIYSLKSTHVGERKLNMNYRRYDLNRFNIP